MRLVIEGGRYDVAIGGSSEDIRLKGAFEVTSDKTLKGRGVFATAVKVTKA